MDTRDALKRVLKEVATRRDCETRWLNTLSLLEFVGARKIGKTMCQTHPPAVVLDHWADETRHAYAFKQLCERLNDGACTEYLAEEASVNYFQSLDQRASAWVTEQTGVDDPFQNYLLVTTLIERRAMTVYPLYRSATEHDFIKDGLQQIVVEEQDHRVELEERCVAMLGAKGIAIDGAFTIEEDLFGGLIHELAEEVGCAVD